MPLNRTADANFHANPWAVSIETSDNAPGRPEDIVAWSPKQLAALIRLGNWLADEWRVPRRQCPAWDASGFGWHAMWGAPSHWTNVAGKVCPGRRRINQLRTVVFPAIFEGTEGDFFMALTDSQQQEILAAARQVNQAVGQGQLNYSSTIEAILSTVQQVEQPATTPSTVAAMLSCLTVMRAPCHLASNCPTLTRHLSSLADRRAPTPQSAGAASVDESRAGLPVLAAASSWSWSPSPTTGLAPAPRPADLDRCPDQRLWPRARPVPVQHGLRPEGVPRTPSRLRRCAVRASPASYTSSRSAYRAVILPLRT